MVGLKRERCKRVASQSLVAFLIGLLLLGQAPTQLWAQGAESLVAAVESAQPVDAPLAEQQPVVDDVAAAPEADDRDDASAPDAANEPETSAPASTIAGGEPAEPEAAPLAAGADAVTDEDGLKNADLSRGQDVFSVDASIIGVDADGNTQVWAAEAAYEVEPGATAADLSERMFEAAGIEADYGTGDWGWYLNTITSPHDGAVLGWDQQTGRFWQLFVNGEPSEVGAGEVALESGDVVTWCYSAFGDALPSLMSASASVVGVDADGNTQVWAAEATYEVEPGATAADLSERMFEAAGIEADYGTGDWGWYLNTITSPHDGAVLGWDQQTGRFWQLFVNGEPSEVGAGEVSLESGDVVTWCYSAFGDALPTPQDVVINPNAPRPELDSEWPGFTNSSKPVTALTPVAAAEEKWTLNIGNGKGLPEPIIVGGHLYTASENKLYKIDASTGSIEGQAALASPIDSTSRMVYADGIVVVPLHGGRLQALTADALATVWLTAALPAENGVEQQSLGTLTVRGGYVYAGTTDGSYDGSGTGHLFCVSLADGSVTWMNNVHGGYYWAGSVAFGDYLVVGDDAGYVYAYDPETGKTMGTPLNLGVQVRSTMVADGTYLYAADYKGTLHKLSMEADGSIVEISKVAFGKYCTSTPAIVDGKIIVCGQSATQGPSKWMKYAAIFVIDANSMVVEHEVVDLADGSKLPTMYSQSSPLVSVQPDGVYAYFTVNWNPSGLYRYKLGESVAEAIYMPSEQNQQYCMSSVVAGADGSIYYVNDSGTLFALKGAPSFKVSFDLQDGSNPAYVFVRQGLAASEPEAPARDGYAFRGWCADAACTTPWDFSQVIPSDMTLYAKWEKIEKPKPPIEAPSQKPSAPDGAGQGAGNDIAQQGGAPVGESAAGKKPLGSVAPSKKPVAAIAAAGLGDDTAKKVDAAEPAGTPAAKDDGDLAEGNKIGAREDDPSSKDGVAPFMIGAGVLGVIGLAAAVIWLFLSNRRKTEN